MSKLLYQNKKSNTNEFIEKSKLVHLDRYDYSLVKYKNAKSKVKIICKKHGLFEQAPTKHLYGNGCPVCKSSRGENSIFNELTKMNIDFTHHHRLTTNRLEFDFYIESMNVAIEFDGIQHFKPIKRFGGIKAFKDQLDRDKRKNEYCFQNNIRLIRIPYHKYDEIKSILNSSLRLY